MPKTSILQKFEIRELNSMQYEASKAMRTGADVVLLSPTGTGKTLAFLLPLIDKLDEKSKEIQALILVPTRELAQQIESVVRKMGSGIKVNAVYGGRSGTLDKIDLKHRPAILIGTPGRVADRFRRDNLELRHIKTLILDEYDKSLEIGFEKEMEQIIKKLPTDQQRILTSATSEVQIPGFVDLNNPVFIDYLERRSSQLVIKKLLSPEKDKLEALAKSLAFIGPQPGIIFCNFKNGLQRVSDFLLEQGIQHECFHGSMEQSDRERALIKFRNGTSQLLLATDLAARGLDIPEIQFILHYHLPPREKEFTHRNGRTARMGSDGVAYLLAWENEALPEYTNAIEADVLHTEDLQASTLPEATDWITLYISGGRKDKISKGDIAGLFMKQGEIQKEQLGVIELQQTCAFVGVHANVVNQLIAKTNNTKLKKKKVRVSLA